MQTTPKTNIELTDQEKAHIADFMANVVIPAQGRAAREAVTHEQRFVLSNLACMAMHEVWLALRNSRETRTTASIASYVHAFERLWRRRPYLFKAEHLQAAYQMQIVCMYVLRCAIHAFCNSNSGMSLSVLLARARSFGGYLIHRARFRRWRDRPVIEHLYENEFYLQGDHEQLFHEITHIKDNTKRRYRFWE